jgi:uncharacterized RDD family membrane protein YckC
MLRRCLPPASACACAAAAPRRLFSRSAAPAFIFGRRFLARSLFRKRHHATDEPLSSEKLGFWNQWMLPPDLRLPAPADPLRRLGAGLLDAALAAGVGGAAAAAVSASGGGGGAAAEAGAAAALLAWALRDAAAPASDGGCRSPGKRAFGLELARADGSLPSRGAAAARGAYWAALPAAALHPLAGMGAAALLAFDFFSTTLTVDARKVGDYVAGTRVVDAPPGRAERVADAAAADEIRALRDEIEALAPGELAASTHPDDEWYEALRARHASNKEIIARAADAAAAAAAAAAATTAAAPPRSAALHATPPARRVNV